MPLYVYQCPDCGHDWEEFHKYDEVIEKCPKCGMNNSKKVPVATSFEIKGKGAHKPGMSRAK